MGQWGSGRSRRAWKAADFYLPPPQTHRQGTPGRSLGCSPQMPEVGGLSWRRLELHRRRGHGRADARSPLAPAGDPASPEKRTGSRRNRQGGLGDAEVMQSPQVLPEPGSEGSRGKPQERGAGPEPAPGPSTRRHSGQPAKVRHLFSLAPVRTRRWSQRVGLNPRVPAPDERSVYAPANLA